MLLPVQLRNQPALPASSQTLDSPSGCVRLNAAQKCSSALSSSAWRFSPERNHFQVFRSDSGKSETLQTDTCAAQTSRRDSGTHIGFAAPQMRSSAADITTKATFGVHAAAVGVHAASLPSVSKKREVARTDPICQKT